MSPSLQHQTIIKNLYIFFLTHSNVKSDPLYPKWLYIPLPIKTYLCWYGASSQVERKELADLGFVNPLCCLQRPIDFGCIDCTNKTIHWLKWELNLLSLCSYVSLYADARIYRNSVTRFCNNQMFTFQCIALIKVYIEENP